MEAGGIIVIVFTLFIGLAAGFMLAGSFSRKKTAPSSVPPAESPSHVMSPPQQTSYLEDKLWFESRLSFLFNFEQRLISAVGLADVIKCIAEAAHNFLAIERTVYLAWDKKSEKLNLVCAIGWSCDRSREPFVIDKESVSGYVIRNRIALVASDAGKCPHAHLLRKEEYLRESFISVPLIYQNEALGVLHVSGKKTPGPFAEREVAFLNNIVRMGVIALQNAQLFAQMSQRAVELKKAYDELKEMQDKLIQAEKLKAIGQLASGVVHDMRNPLGIIMQGVSYLETILPPEDLDQRQTLTMVKESVLRADKIIISMLDFARETKLELHPEDIGAILESSLHLVKAQLKDIEVVREINPDVPWVSADKNKLTQVFINLFTNAIHAMQEKGRLTVRVDVKMDADLTKSVVVEIEDTGSGISENNLRQVFDPFFTTKGAGKGTGLGLSVSRNIINLHKGRIDITSQVNKGTKVTVTLRTA